jgi:hypothetical protein
MYVCVCVHVCMYVCMYICKVGMHLFLLMYACPESSVCMRYIHTYIHAYIHTYTHIQTNLQVSTRVRLFAYTYIHTYTDTYIHIQTNLQVSTRARLNLSEWVLFVCLYIPSNKRFCCESVRVCVWARICELIPYMEHTNTHTLSLCVCLSLCSSYLS